MFVEAPGRLSTTTLCPMTSVIFWPSTRTTTSTMPPGGTGTITRTDLLGYDWATACCAKMPKNTAKPKLIKRMISSRLFDLEIERLDHLAPLRCFGLDVLCEFFGRIADGLRALRDQALFDVRQIEDTHDFLVELVHNVLRRAGWHRKAEPACRLETRHAEG